MSFQFPLSSTRVFLAKSNSPNFSTFPHLLADLLGLVRSFGSQPWFSFNYLQSTQFLRLVLLRFIRLPFMSAIRRIIASWLLIQYTCRILALTLLNTSQGNIPIVLAKFILLFSKKSIDQSLCGGFHFVLINFHFCVFMLRLHDFSSSIKRIINQSTSRAIN